MLQTAKNTFVSALIACLAALLTPAAAEETRLEKTLHPLGLKHAGIYALRQIEPSLTGAGVKYAVISRSFTYINGEPQNDYRPNIEHNCFKNSQLTFYDQGKLPAGVSPHSTAICSILFGEDANAFNPYTGHFHYQGAVPAAQGQVYEFWHFLINNIFSHSPPDADIVTASIGNEFEDWWTRGIESLAEHYGLIIVAGIGNGNNAYDLPLYPGAAANVIGVGVVNSVNTENLTTNLAHFSLAYPEHSSYGPTDSGRSKPDIVAPGNCLSADANEPNSYEATGNFSSFSTPVVAGTIGLLVQKAKEDQTLSSAIAPEGGNCVIKAILLNSATKLPYWHKGRLGTDDDHTAPLDHIQGAGMLNAVSAYKHLIAGAQKPGNVPTTGWDNNLLEKPEQPQNVYGMTVAEPDDKIITITTAWNKHYKKAYPFEPAPEKDSNLRLELWAVDPNDPNNDYLLDYSDSSIDNVEHIYSRSDPNYTNYEIVVSFSDFNDENKTAGIQRYGLAWNISGRQDDSIFWYDLNADGIVDKADFIIMIENWVSSRKSSDNYLFGDINTDGVIDVKDAEILMDYADLKADWYKEQL